MENQPLSTQELLETQGGLSVIGPIRGPIILPPITFPPIIKPIGPILVPYPLPPLV
ncbi:MULTISPECIES: hypothetical protein [Siphonobacter]|uniref:hypothetical protein n=1 Tax=Siphonobacter TaxID=700450 RepID=UPI0013047EE8|nr:MULTISPECIES: hypothetical protein [Siphonobacter]